MSLKGAMEKAAEDLNLETIRSQQQAEWAALEAKQSRQLVDKLDRLGQEVVNECRLRNIPMVGICEYNWIRPRFLRGWRIDITLVERMWLLEGFLLGQHGEICRLGSRTVERDLCSRGSYGTGGLNPLKVDAFAKAKNQAVLELQVSDLVNRGGRVVAAKGPTLKSLSDVVATIVDDKLAIRVRDHQDDLGTDVILEDAMARGILRYSQR